MGTRYALPYGVYSISSKPGLPQVAICHDFYVLAEVRGQGFGHKLMESLLQSVVLANFDYAICTTSSLNFAMHACLLRACWTLSGEFHNRRTNEQHQVWHNNLMQVRRPALHAT